MTTATTSSPTTATPPNLKDLVERLGGIRTVGVYTPDGSLNRLDNSQALDGGIVLPGFVLEIGELFSELDRHG
jgi:hypothetical protein